MTTLLAASPTKAIAPVQVSFEDVVVGLDPDARHSFDPFTPPTVVTTIAAVCDRRRVAVAGRVGAIGERAWGPGLALEVTLDDGTATIDLAFVGRRQIAGIVTGCDLVAAGAVGRHCGRRVILNPCVWLTARD